MSSRSAACANPGCARKVGRPETGRRRLFCSDACRKQTARNRLPCPKTPGKADIAEDPRNVRKLAKKGNNSSGLQGRFFSSDNAAGVLHWVKVNDCTWKLTEGSKSLTPPCHGFWGGYYTDFGVAWAFEVGWPFGKSAWYARCGDNTYGPTDLKTAKQAALAFATGAPLPQSKQGSAFTGPVNLHADPGEVEDSLANETEAA